MTLQIHWQWQCSVNLNWVDFYIQVCIYLVFEKSHQIALDVLCNVRCTTDMHISMHHLMRQNESCKQIHFKYHQKPDSAKMMRLMHSTWHLNHCYKRTDKKNKCSNVSIQKSIKFVNFTTEDFSKLSL